MNAREALDAVREGIHCEDPDLVPAPPVDGVQSSAALVSCGECLGCKARAALPDLASAVERLGDYEEVLADKRRLARALSGRTVSCENCNAMAAAGAALRERLAAVEAERDEAVDALHKIWTGSGCMSEPTAFDAVMRLREGRDEIYADRQALRARLAAVEAERGGTRIALCASVGEGTESLAGALMDDRTALRARLERAEAALPEIMAVAREAHMLGRIYSQGGEKHSPAVVEKELTIMSKRLASDLRAALEGPEGSGDAT